MIRCQRVVKRYLVGDHVILAVDDISFDLEDGSFCAIVGQSGSGKSTLMHMIGGLDHPTSGQLSVNNIQLFDLSPQKLAAFRGRTMGFVFQSFFLISHLQAVENVEMVLSIQGVSRRERRKRARAVLDRVGMGERWDHRPSELSGGEQQRVAIARALVGEPSFILADEPTGNLDSVKSNDILQLLRDLHRDEGKTIILVTHNEQVADRYSDRIIRLKDGRIDMVCPPTEGGDA